MVGDFLHTRVKEVVASKTLPLFSKNFNMEEMLQGFKLLSWNCSYTVAALALKNPKEVGGVT